MWIATLVNIQVTKDAPLNVLIACKANSLPLPVHKYRARIVLKVGIYQQALPKNLFVPCVSRVLVKYLQVQLNVTIVIRVRSVKFLKAPRVPNAMQVVIKIKMVDRHGK